MKAMILAAGRGERLKPITDTIPKPLVCVRKKPLIFYHLEKLAQAGFKEVVINLAYLGDKIQDILNDGSAFGLKIIYSPEGDRALETGGGIVNALPLLGNEPFITINADIFTEFDFSHLNEQLLGNNLAHLIVVPTQPYHLSGDFSLIEDSKQGLTSEEKHYLISNDFPRSYIASGISLYHPHFFNGLSVGQYSIAPLWRQQAEQGNVGGSVFLGAWHDVGTIERLKAIDVE